MFFPHWNLKQWLVGLVISSLLGFLFRLCWKAFRYRQRELSVLPKTQSVFAVVRNKTYEIFLGDGARARHKGEFFIRLKRLAYVYLWRKMAAALRITNAKSAAEVRRLDAATMPPRVRETLRRSFYRFCRDGYQFLRNRWHGFSQWRQRCWQRFQAWRRRKRIDRLPVTNALTQRKRNRILDAAAALLRGDARWRVWLRSLPGIGRWFGSNQQPTAEERTRAERAENRKLYIAGGALLAASSLYGLGITFGTLASILFAYLILLAGRLIVAGKANYVGNRQLLVVLKWKTTLAVAAIAAVIWLKT